MRLRTIWIALAVAVLALPASAAEHVLRLDPGATTVSFHLAATGHDVEGSLVVNEGEIRFDPETGEASGAISVDAKRAETGNRKRDKTMHEDVLESERFPLFVFRPTSISGEFRETGKSDITLEGSMAIHGGEHPMTLPATVTVEGDRLSGETRFTIPFVAWGMEDPSWFVLRVAKEVEVTVEIRGTVSREPSDEDRTR